MDPLIRGQTLLSWVSAVDKITINVVLENESRRVEPIPYVRWTKSWRSTTYQ